MKICISASIKFKDTILKVSKILSELDIPHHRPNMELPKEQETPKIIAELIKEHFGKIDQSEAILIVNPTGYFGNSVKIEIGYTKGRGKKIYFLEKTNEPELDCLADDFISIDNLEKLK
ncbi:hypothetical protein HQ544_04540 [Candidatus Falkowbacteria bacterium]|nr:hypothetical protein [Candidatus Falkowbacteria bacterium]